MEKLHNPNVESYNLCQFKLCDYNCQFLERKLTVDNNCRLFKKKIRRNYMELYMYDII